MSVYKAINAVQTDLARVGLAKDSTNTFDNYKFRGIDAVYNALSPLLAKHGLCILPRMISRDVQERASQKGGVLFYVTVEAEFDFVCAEDGSKHTVRTFGEAMDRGDKATNKAMSAAYKYAAFQAFAIPTEGDNDADAHTHEVKAAAPKHTPTGTPVVSPARMSVIADVATAVRDHMDADDLTGAYEEASGLTDPEERTQLWKMLDSKTRSALKGYAEQLKEKAGFSRA